MGGNPHSFKTQVLLFLIVVGAWTLWLPKIAHHASPAAGSPHKVHIAFGFHVNLYHSFRGDTNDENGFGQDIRVIRHTIDTLDRFNRQGIPVRAVWDFDNLFSLQERLPAYAPDVIGDVRRRVDQSGDDVILMSYNNGLMSAMTDREFTVSMQRAVTNANRSGVKDLFGRIAPVVRPQEMMTTPGSFKRYAALGIEAVALYYSATPFDAFRLFSRELTPTEAYNPITYRNSATDEKITILPTYHPGDLVENVSLRDWAEKLHGLQEQGRIDRDVLIFINFDADAEFWTGADLPWHLDWLPNTGGLAQLIDSVSDLDFVAFSNVSDYLADHEPVGTVRFGQDTADGSFNGYNSWAEKACASDYWTRIERNRRVHRIARALLAMPDGPGPSPVLDDLLHNAFETRLRALSTTNFGLATPFPARSREAAMASILDRLDGYSDKIEAQLTALAEPVITRHEAANPSGGHRRVVQTFLHLASGTAGDRYLSFILPARMQGVGGYVIADAKGRRIPTMLEKKKVLPGGDRVALTLRISGRERMPDGIYTLYRQTDAPAFVPAGDHRLSATPRLLENAFIRIRFDDRGRIVEVAQNGAVQLDGGSILPYIVYRGHRYAPRELTVTATQNDRQGVATVRLQGPWPGPAGVSRAPGWVDYRLRLLRGVPYLFIDGEVAYPDTRRDAVIQADKPMLARKIDDGWQEVAPVELRFAHHADRDHPFVVHKRNYLGVEDAYAVDYFRHSPENVNVADINNHITAAYVGVTTRGRGMAVAMNTAVKANFAFSPLKMHYLPQTDAFAIRANPFGTYYGDQIVPPTRGNGLGYEAVVLSAPQLHSAAPTYNGYHDRFDLMVAFFDGDAIPEDVKADLIGFARRPAAIAPHAGAQSRTASVSSLPPAGFLALADENGVVFHWETMAVPGVRYRIRLRPLGGGAAETYSATGNTQRIGASAFSGGREAFAASIQAVYPDGRTSERSPEIHLKWTRTADRPLKIPNGFKIKVLWASVTAWMQRNLL